MSRGVERERFQRLMQPIRDLAENWDIDLAHDLEDYMEELMNIEISFDGGATVMNFAEAAMVVQGSAGIYSKKVEYLYSMTCGVLDMLVQKKKMQKQQGEKQGEDKEGGGGEEDGDEDSNTSFSHHRGGRPEFLSLDDIECKDYYYLKNDDESSVELLPKIPLSLINTDSADTKDDPLFNAKGEIFADLSDFSMNSAFLHIDGTLLLDQMWLRYKSPQDRPDIVVRMPEGGRAEMIEAGAFGDEANKAVDLEIPMNTSAGGDDVDTNDVFPVHLEEAAPQSSEVIRRSERKRDGARVMAPKEFVDPWKELDPHEGIPGLERPFRKARTFKHPMGLDKRGNLRPWPGKVIPISDFVIQAFSDVAGKLPSNPLKAPSFPEFETLYWAETKRRQARQRREKILLAHQGMCQFLAEDEEELFRELSIAENPVADDDTDNGVDFVVPEMPEDLELLQQPVTLNHLPFERSQLESVDVLSSYEELVRQMVDDFLVKAGNYAQVTEVARRVTEWEEKIRPILKETEEHGPFDIHIYGTNIIDSFADDCVLNKWIPFRTLAANKPQYEVSRLFLATLQLANDYNVEIKPDPALDTGMSLKLLSRRRRREEMDHYQAPSWNTQA